MSLTSCVCFIYSFQVCSFFTGLATLLVGICFWLLFLLQKLRRERICCWFEACFCFEKLIGLVFFVVFEILYFLVDSYEPFAAGVLPRAVAIVGFTTSFCGAPVLFQEPIDSLFQFPANLGSFFYAAGGGGNFFSAALCLELDLFLDP